MVVQAARERPPFQGTSRVALESFTELSRPGGLSRDLERWITRVTTDIGRVQPSGRLP
jgi:hypothetical protein